MPHKRSKETHDKFVRNILRLDLFLNEHHLGRVESHEHPFFTQEETRYGNLTIHANNDHVIREMLNHVETKSQDYGPTARVKIDEDKTSPKYTVTIIPSEFIPRSEWFHETDNMISHILPIIRHYEHRFNHYKKQRTTKH